MQVSWKSLIVSLYIWFFIGSTILPLFLVYLVIWVLAWPFDSGKLVTHYYTGFWSRLYLTINPGWSILIENLEKIDTSKPYILVSNHQSIIDIALLLQLRINFKWVSKLELARIPFIGWVIWMNNHIVVRRGDKKSVIQMSEACRKALSAGIYVVMFPEGTRSRNGDIQVFKEGAFILARNTLIPILPVILDGAGEALPRKGFWFKVNQIFTVRILDEIPAETINRLELQQLMDYTRDIMVNQLEELRTTKRE